MRKAAILIIALVVLSACSTGVSAQKGTYWLSLPLSVVVPTGDLADVGGTSYGIGFGIGYWITDSWLLSGKFAYHNFGEKKVAEGYKINGSLMPIDIGITYMFMKDSKYRPYASIRTGSYTYGGDFEGELGQKNKAGSSLGLGIAFISGYEGRGMLFIEPEYHAVFADDTHYYWTFNFGVSWNIGG